jgi:hypothetical protein
MATLHMESYHNPKKKKRKKKGHIICDGMLVEKHQDNENNE